MSRRERRAAGRKSQPRQNGPDASSPAVLYDAGLHHLRAGRHLEAQTYCQRALAVDPNHADTLHLMGLLSLDAGQHDHALEWLARAIRQNPKPEYLASLGTTLQQQGRREEALNAFDRATQLRPDDATMWRNLGNILIDLERPDDALLSFQHALKLDPHYWDAAHKSGFLLYKSGRFDEALAPLELCCELQPNHVATRQLRALSLRGLKRFEEALAENQRAYALDPNDADTCNNIGDGLQAFSQHDEAVPWFDRALALRPNFIQALNNKAFSLGQIRRFDEAFAIYSHLKQVGANTAGADWNLALLNMLTGDFEAGWAGREARWRIPGLSVAYPKFSEPMWLGDGDITGKTVLIRVDEGLGDSIQFARYVPMVAALGARVILVVADAVHSLLSGLPGVAECFPVSAATLPAFDLHCPLSSLPLVFGTRLDTIPPGISYLPPCPEARVQAWQDRLQHRLQDPRQDPVGQHDKLRVGLVWSGNPAHGNDRNRSLPLRMLSGILDLDATFVSLQKDPRPDDKVVLQARGDIVDFSADLADFSETAALVSCLDLVITVDTSVAHLAAALGRPTWILLPYTPDYRWLLDRDDSPWYPSVRLFRQTESRDYAAVLDRVRSELATLISANRPRSEIDLGTPHALHEAGLRHMRAGRHLDARACCQQALAMDPEHPGSLHLMGLLARQAQQHDHAIAWIAHAIQADPKPEYLSSLGTTLQQQGRHEEALKALDKAVQLEPDNAELWKNLGGILVDLQRPADALLSFQHALTLSPRDRDAAYKSLFLLHGLGRFEEALTQYEICDALQPGHVPALQLRALALRGLNRPEQALAENRRAQALDPQNADTCNNIGDVLQSLGRQQEALEWFDKALERRPDFIAALKNSASVLKELHRFDQAIAIYHRVKALDPDDAGAECELSLLHLLTGQFEAGWVEREARFKILSTYPKFSQPVWRGEDPIEGKTILVYADEGIGDSIQFARYLPVIAARGARIILVVEEPACSLLSGLSGVSQYLSKSDLKSGLVPLPAFDLHCPMCSLPLAFGTQLDNIPPGISYLPPLPGTRVQAWRNRIQKAAGGPDRPRVGLIWSGNPLHRNDHNRSLPLRLLTRLLDVDAAFVSLQKDPRPDDQAVLLERPDIIDLTADLSDFSETAALVSCLDLVITVDTSVAHLAAALGRPTWILLPYTPDYRWLLDRDDSPWYPTVRLFRQTESRDYGEVLDRVRRALARRLSPGADGNTPATLCEAALRYLRAGAYDDAQACCEEALTLDAGRAEALHLMGLLAMQSKHHDRAVDWMARAIRQNAKPEYLYSLGRALQLQGRLEDSLNAFDRAIQLKPDDAELRKSLGVVLVALKRSEEALLSFRQALTLDPRHWDAAYRCAHVLYEQKNWEEALRYLDLCHELQPDQAAIPELRALVLQNLNRLEQALAENERALVLNPANADTCNNAGTALQLLGRDAEALPWFERSLQLRPGYITALTNKASSLHLLHRFDEAAAVYNEAMQLKPDEASAELGLAHLHLLTGNFEAGWAGREARWRVISDRHVGYPKLSQPMWLGHEDIKGKTLLLGADEGMGDTLQFIRYLPMVVERGARIILVVQDALYPLLSGLPGLAQCLPISATATLPAFDVHCPLMSLPLVFETRLDSIPTPQAYLPPPPPARVQAWQDRLEVRAGSQTTAARHGKLRVGLVWSGNPLHKNDHNRSSSLHALAPILDLDATFVSLQKDPRPEDKAILRKRGDIIDLTEDLTDFVETAALVSCLDLVITVDTSVAHLAAALGRPTWIMLPYTPDYRWLLDRDDSPWYPTVRLFRQSETRDYKSVLNRVRDQLAKLIAAK